MTAQRTALKSGGFAASARRLRNFANHPYPSLERRGLARFQFIHTLIDHAYRAEFSNLLLTHHTNEAPPQTAEHVDFDDFKT